MATASVTLSLNNSAFLAGMARARASVSALGASAAGLAGQGLKYASAAVLALGTATAVGIKKAFDFGGKLADMSAISGRSVRSILLLRRALEDAGISMEKIDRFILTGQDRGEVIARALKNMSSGDWADAAKSVGTQADILDKNAKTFDRVSDLLGRTGSKLQGFFVGAASAVSKSLLPFLEKFDKMDFAGQGERFGAALLSGAQALAGFFNDPQKLFGVFQDSFTAVILGIGNLLIAVFKKALAVLQAGAQAAFESLMTPGGAGKGLLNSIDRGLINSIGKNMSGEPNAIGRQLQKQIDKREETARGPSFADRMLEISNQTPLEIADVFSARGAAANAQSGIAGAAGIGRGILPTPGGATGFGQSAEERAAAGRQKLAASYAAQEAIRSQIVGGGESFGEAGFRKRDMDREDEFASRWGLPKPSEMEGGKSKDSEVPAAVKEAMTETMDKYWGKK